MPASLFLNVAGLQGLTVSRATTFVLSQIFLQQHPSFPRVDDSVLQQVIWCFFHQRWFQVCCCQWLRDKLSVSSLVVVPQIPQTLPMSHPYTLSWRLSIATTPCQCLPHVGPARLDKVMRGGAVSFFLLPLPPSSSATSSPTLIYLLSVETAALLVDLLFRSPETQHNLSQWQIYCWIPKIILIRDLICTKIVVNV